MRFAFIKCHGSGNDFPLIDARWTTLDDEQWGVVARALADRDGAVGGDGLLLLTAGDRDHDFGMRMFNSDGSEAEQCLNGLRCVARAGFERQGLSEATVRCKRSSNAVARAEDLAPGVHTVRELAGPVSLDLAEWPMAIGRAENVEQPIERLGSARAFTAVAMPNPHLVSFVDRVEEAELVAIGERCEAAPAWLPRRANVSFVEQRGGDLFVRTFERGVGLTDSCGTAMGASTYAACLTGRVAYDREITVFNKGGLIRASADVGGEVTLLGNATWEWAGEIEVDLETGVAHALEVTQRYPDEVEAWTAAIAR